MPDVSVCRAEELGRAEREAWCAFRAADPLLASPYFSLDFLDAMAGVRHDVRVLVTREAGRPAAFLPLHTGLLGHARPLGGPLGDHHGLIAEPGARIDLARLVEAGGIAVYDFFGVPGNQGAFRAHGRIEDGSWVIDLSEGFDAYLARRTALEPKAFRNLRARERKIEEAGPVLRVDDRRAHVLEAGLAWKSAQYRRTGHLDVFSVGWTRDLMSALLASRGETRGLVSSLEIGGRLAAVHVGMRSARVMHYWFPSYDPDFSQFGPGLALLMRLAQALSEDGVQEIHLGPGDYDFKAQLGSWQFPLVRGYVGRPSFAGAVRALAGSLERAGDALPRPVGGLPGRVFRRIDLMAGIHAR